MIKLDIETLINEELKKPLEDIEYNLVKQKYSVSKEKKTRKFLFEKYSSINNEFISEYNLFSFKKNLICLCSKNNEFNINHQETFYLAGRDLSVINPEIIEAIYLISSSSNLVKDLKCISKYRNIENLSFILTENTYVDIFGDKIELNKLNLFFTYILSFGSNWKLFYNKSKIIKSKIESLIINQIRDLPDELSLESELEIIEKIVSNLIISYFSKRKHLKIVNKIDKLKYEENNIIFLDLFFKRNLAISKYVIPEIINHIKLSHANIERIVSLCQIHFKELIRLKLNEIEVSIEDKELFLSYFESNIVFSAELYNQKNNQPKIYNSFVKLRYEKSYEEIVLEIQKSIYRTFKDDNSICSIKPSHASNREFNLSYSDKLFCVDEIHYILPFIKQNEIFSNTICFEYNDIHFIVRYKNMEFEILDCC